MEQVIVSIDGNKIALSSRPKELTIENYVYSDDGKLAYSNLRTVGSANVIKTVNSYDDNGKITDIDSELVPIGSLKKMPGKRSKKSLDDSTVRVHYTYDDKGRVISITRNGKVSRDFSYFVNGSVKRTRCYDDKGFIISDKIYSSNKSKVHYYSVSGNTVTEYTCAKKEGYLYETYNVYTAYRPDTKTFNKVKYLYKKESKSLIIPDGAIIESMSSYDYEKEENVRATVSKFGKSNGNVVAKEMVVVTTCAKKDKLYSKTDVYKYTYTRSGEIKDIYLNGSLSKKYIHRKRTFSNIVDMHSVFDDKDNVNVSALVYGSSVKIDYHVDKNNFDVDQFNFTVSSKDGKLKLEEETVPGFDETLRCRTYHLYLDTDEFTIDISGLNEYHLKSDENPSASTLATSILSNVYQYSRKYVTKENGKDLESTFVVSASNEVYNYLKSKAVEYCNKKYNLKQIIKNFVGKNIVINDNN